MKGDKVFLVSLITKPTLTSKKERRILGSVVADTPDEAVEGLNFGDKVRQRLRRGRRDKHLVKACLELRPLEEVDAEKILKKLDQFL